MKKISFVIPCYGSESTISWVLAEIRSIVAQRPEFCHEIICVNDCSPDHVLEVLKTEAENNTDLTVIDLAKNMGKHSAVMAGYANVGGDLIVTMDDDGQCPVDKLWIMVDELDKGFDMVMAKYPKQKQSAFKNFGSDLNDFMSRTLLGKPKGLRFTNFHVMRQFVLDEILRYKNPYPYQEGLILRVTNRIGFVEMEERERHAGQGAFTFSKSFSLLMNGFTAFSIKPLRIASVTGTIFALVGFVFIIILIIRSLIGNIEVMGWSSTMAVMLFIGGVVMMMLGLIGEYIGRIYISLNNSPQYVIREIYRSGR